MSVTKIGNKNIEIVKVDGGYNMLVGPDDDKYARYCIPVDEKGLLDMIALFNTAKSVFSLEPWKKLTSPFTSPYTYPYGQSFINTNQTGGTSNANY